jgi:uncharacterized protein YegL
MKENLTSINVILDGSGSMGRLVNDTIGGFNQFLQDQQALPGEALLSLTIFNTKPTVVHDCLPIANVPALNKDVYKASGGTALLDAVGLTVDNVGQKLASMREEDRPSKILFLIITDGEENASSIPSDDFVRILEDVKRKTAAGKGHYGVGTPKLKYPLERIKEMIEHQTSKYNWEFVFLGANIDAFGEGGKLGVAAGNTLQYDASGAGVRGMYKSISQGATRLRSRSAKSSGGFFGNNS